MQVKVPTEEVEISFTITESIEGKLGIHVSIPEHAAGTIALLLADACMEIMRGMMADAKLKERSFTESRLQ